MSNKRGHTILLGGLGGDSHSVGLTILRQSLSANGYQVRYLGTQNTLGDFFQMSSLANLVMISSMDGHARYYLREFPAFKRQFNTKTTIWYLGENLGVSDGCERDFIEMGFNRVFVKFIELTTVLNILERDLDGVQAVANYPELWKHSLPATCCFPGGATGIELIKGGLAAASDCYVDEARVAEECAVIRREVEAIFESIVLCGNGDIAQGVVTGFEKGLMDIPFSPSVHNRGEVMTTRDVEGAVRFLSIGNLRLDRESREFHQDKVSERRKAEGICSPSQDHLLVERDVMQVACCRYEHWPLGQ